MAALSSANRAESEPLRGRVLLQGCWATLRLFGYWDGLRSFSSAARC